MEKIKVIDDERFDTCYVNYDHAFDNEKLVGEFAVHARKRINGKLYWHELIVTGVEKIPMYLDELEAIFKQYD